MFYALPQAVIAKSTFKSLQSISSSVRSEGAKSSKMAIPKTYFRNVDASVWIGVPIVFGLLPLAGFNPSALDPYLPSIVMAFVLANQVLTFTSST